MKTTLPKKSQSHEATIKKISDVIVKAGGNKIAFVILFGSFARGDWVYDTYVEDHTTYEYASDYDILVIAKGKSTIHSLNNLENKIQKTLDRVISGKHSVSFVVEPIEKVNSKLEVRHYFFSDIKKEGILLYSSGEIELSEPKNLSNEERAEIASEDYKFWFEKAKEFLTDCQNAFKRKSYSNSVFYLHQATESLYHAILLVFTGYKPKIHDIKRLGKKCSSYSPKFLTVFPQITEEQKECFKLLKLAYVESRYEQGYSINKKQLEYLISRVEKLREITKEVCLYKIKSFNS